jgi:hypothetical protein
VPRDYWQNGIELGFWISKQRTVYKRGHLRKDRIERLESLEGWSWDSHDDKWDRACQELGTFVREHGHALVPHTHQQNGVALGTWITKQRSVYKRGDLRKDRIERLESLKGWSWSPLEDEWDSVCRELEAFVREHGHALVPDSYRQNGIRLGSWINKQRTDYKRGNLPSDRVERLESISGWSWNTLEDRWKGSYHELETFVKEHGHALVPRTYQHNGIQLATWIQKQRSVYKRGELPRERVKRLESIKGWSWHGRRTSRTKSVPEGRRNQ